MQNIRTVNMVREERFRGTYPVSRYALADDGGLTLAVPRPLEARAFDVTHLKPDGGAEVQGGFAVETLLKLEMTARGGDALGMTADDIYLFHAGSKGRFLGERRLSYVDAALSADGRKVAAGFSDMSGASFALAYGEIDGHVAWMRDVDMPLSALSLSRDGGRIALGGENGILLLVDLARRDVWTFEQEEPVRALASSTDGLFTAYGTAQGSLGLIDGDGGRQWESRLTGEIVALALSGDGSVCGALSRANEMGGTTLTCLVGKGQVAWEFHADKRLIGLTLSENGRCMATSARDGTVSVYEIVPGETPISAVVRADAHVQAEEQAQAGDLEGALRTLYAALEADPADAAACEALLAYRAQWMEARLNAAQAQADGNDFAAAAGTLEAMLTLEPHLIPALTALESLRALWAERLRAEADRYNADGDYHAAEAALLEAVRNAPLLPEARRELASLRVRRAADAAAEAQRLMALGDLEAGVAALEQAQAFAPSAERADELAKAQTAQEFAAGMAHYQAKRYQEAVFQFKKVLVRDPHHAEALRHLGYAQKFVQDANANLSDRFQRLE